MVQVLLAEAGIGAGEIILSSPPLNFVPSPLVNGLIPEAGLFRDLFHVFMAPHLSLSRSGFEEVPDLLLVSDLVQVYLGTLLL
jgi:hypothetical protein